MKFGKIGLRDLNVVNFKQSQLKDMKDCCPYCNYGPLDGVSKTEFSDSKNTKSEKGPLPEDGCPSICFNCSGLLIYRVQDEVISIDKPSEKEISEWQSEHVMWDTLTKMQEVIKKASGIKSKRF